MTGSTLQRHPIPQPCKVWPLHFSPGLLRPCSSPVAQLPCPALPAGTYPPSLTLPTLPLHYPSIPHTSVRVCQPQGRFSRLLSLVKYPHGKLVQCSNVDLIFLWLIIQVNVCFPHLGNVGTDLSRSPFYFQHSAWYLTHGRCSTNNYLILKLSE